MNMEGNISEISWGAVPRRKRSMLPRKKRDYGEGNVAEETTTTPKWVLEQMENFQGYDANQIMELKELKATDLNTNQGRLSMPKHVDRNFLNDGELRTLAAVPKRGVNCIFIDTKGRDHDLELKEWANGLVLAKGWGNVVKKESFEVGEEYPLWCFRSRNKNDKLCFTLVKPNQVEEVLPNVDNKDAKLSDTEEEEVANKSDTESSSLFGHGHAPNSPDGGDSSGPGEDMMNVSEDHDFPILEEEVESLDYDLDALFGDDSA
ncbi:hypothetical protein N665_0104s0016 [Sinapis alba]|nr:hypothetical protein N665_0104s0016 [Sinapis alba]